MRWFRSKKDAMIEQLVTQVDELETELNLERQKRASAEQVGMANLIRAEKAEEYALRADSARDEAVKLRADSLNLVNTKLLEHISPEGPTPDPKSFTARLGNGAKRIPDTRKRFKDSQLAAMQSKRKPTILESKLAGDEKPTMGLKEGMEALNLDNLIH